MKRRNLLKAAPLGLIAVSLPNAVSSNPDRLVNALAELKSAMIAANPEVTGMMILRDGQGEGKIIGAMAVSS